MKTNFDAMKKKQDTPKVGVGVILMRDGKVLIGQRQGSHRKDTWALPGGHMDVGEDFLDTCKREIQEELGVTIDDVEKVDFANNIFAKEGLHYVTLYFKAVWDESQEPKIMEPEKMKEIRWVDPLKLPSPFFSKTAVEVIKRFGIDMPV